MKKYIELLRPSYAAVPVGTSLVIAYIAGGAGGPSINDLCNIFRTLL